MKVQEEKTMKIKKEHKNKFEFTPDMSKKSKDVVGHKQDNRNRQSHGHYFGKNRWYPDASS